PHRLSRRRRADHAAPRRFSGARDPGANVPAGRRALDARRPQARLLRVQDAAVGGAGAGPARGRRAAERPAMSEGLTLHQTVFALTTSLVTFLFILELVRRRRLREEYSWLWLLTAGVMILMVVWFRLLMI